MPILRGRDEVEVEGRLYKRLVESVKEAKSDKRTTGRRVANGRPTDYRESGTSEPNRRRTRKEKKVEKSWTEIAKCRFQVELKTTDSDKDENESKTTNSVERNDSDKPNHMKAKRMRR